MPESALAQAAAPEREVVPRLVLALIVAAIVQRVVYHWAYLQHDPFALVTIADGQLYEAAARDILSSPPLGTRPFYLQGSYAYLFAAGLSLGHGLPGALCLQLLVAGLGLVLFALAARSYFGPRAGALSLLMLLITSGVAFYENKYLSVSLGLVACIALLWAFARARLRADPLSALVLGLCAGAAMLARPNLLLALPFTLLGLWLSARSSDGHGPARHGRTGRATTLAMLAALGCGLALAPMALRNLAVTGRASVVPSHGGGIPFFIGNNPSANGRWNDANGLLSGQIWLEQRELAQRLGLDPNTPNVEGTIGDALYERAFRFMREQPGAFALLEARKLWYTLGNHAFVRDYDLLGERELLGAAYPIGLPFGIVLALGALGGVGLVCTASRELRSGGELRALPLVCVVFGMVFAVLVANVVWFSSAQNRAPLIVPLALLSGPALDGLWARVQVWSRARVPSPPSAAAFAPPSLAALSFAALLGAQAFVPRLATVRPSSTHYYNLGIAQEMLGQTDAALRHYALATERSPKQPMFWWRRAQLLRQSGRHDEALRALDQLDRIPDVPDDLRRAAERERGLLSTR